MRKHLDWSKNEDEIIKELFLLKKGVSLILEKLPNRTHRQVCKRANNLGLKKFIHNYKFLQQDLFKTPNNINSWLAGVWASDGYINEDQFTLQLAEKDYDFMQKVKNNLGWTGKISYAKKNIDGGFIRGRQISANYGTSIMRIRKYPQQWAHDLRENWSVIPNKTYILKEPNIKNLQTCLSYISGYIDGDGWISQINTEDKPYAIHIGIVGQSKVLKWIKNIFDYLTPFDNISKICKRKDETGDTCSYTISGMRAYIIGRLFLMLDIPRMDRKWDNLKFYINDKDENPRCSLFRSKLDKIKYNYDIFNKNPEIEYNNLPFSCNAITRTKDL